MKFTKEEIDLKNGLSKEWIITNGIGGFSSSTIIGANTRRYHGLLIAPLNPPSQRYLCLSKLDESIEINGNKIPLYTNVCKDYISEGYKSQISFEKEYIPEFQFETNGIKVNKKICMIYGKNTVCVYYKIKNANNNIKVNLSPIINYKGFHEMTTNQKFDLTQDIKNQNVKIIINNKSKPLYMYCSEGNYIEHKNDIFERMYYIEEEKRGFYPEENHAVCGSYEIEINANETKEITYVFSLDKLENKYDGKDIIKNEINRLDKIIKNTDLIKSKSRKTKKEIEEDNIKKMFVIATDNFVAYRPKFKLNTIIAGYPWFLDWGRDSLISFEGILLKTKRYEEAKGVLGTVVRDLKNGLVPNGYSEQDDTPLYNSVDASLLLFEQVNKFIKYTGDYDFIKKEIYKDLIDIVKFYSLGIDLDNNNIKLNEDGLISSGTQTTQNTWMDVKYKGIAATPRNGKVVEVNALWYNALKTLKNITEIFEGKEKAKIYNKMANKCKKSFEEQFYNKRRKCLFDVVGDGKVRPNQLFALSLTYPVIDPKSEIAKQIFETTTKKLKNKYGLKTLAKGEENYVDVYEGNSFKRDMSYHQGITWPWLFGIYVDSLKNIKNSVKTKEEKEEYKKKYDDLIREIKQTYSKAINNDCCIGNIAELYDSKRPQLPKGTVAQAWSVAEIFRIIF